MDRNTLIGLVMIGLILSVFTIVNQPSPEELKKQEAQIALNQKKEAEKQKLQEKAKQAIVSTTVTPDADSSLPTQAKTEKLIRMENEKLIIDFSTKGGKVAAVYLKEFESYFD